MLYLPYAGFSKNRPLADSFIESRCQFIYLSICLSPFHVIFLCGANTCTKPIVDRGSWSPSATRPCINASARPHDGSTRGRWTFCTHPPFLGLHACNKMGSTRVIRWAPHQFFRAKKGKISKKQTFFYAVGCTKNTQKPKKNLKWKK